MQLDIPDSVLQAAVTEALAGRPTHGQSGPRATIAQRAVAGEAPRMTSLLDDVLGELLASAEFRKAVRVKVGGLVGTMKRAELTQLLVSSWAPGPAEKV